MNANTALANALIGTPVTPAIAANTLIIANTISNSDILVAINKGGHSQVVLWGDASASITVLNAPSGGTVQIRIANAVQMTIAANALTGNVVGTGASQVAQGSHTAPAATSSAPGHSELAIGTEVVTGTDAVRAITPGALAAMDDISNQAWVVDENDLVSDSDILLATQQSIKAYVDASGGGGSAKSQLILGHAISGTATLSNFSSNIYSATLIGSASADGIVGFNARMPTGATSVSKALVLCMSEETGVLRYSVSSAFAAEGEAHSANTDSIAETDTGSVTGSVQREIDVTAALTGVAANDTIGLQFTREGAHANDTLTILKVWGLYLEYT